MQDKQIAKPLLSAYKSTRLQHLSVSEGRGEAKKRNPREGGK